MVYTISRPKFRNPYIIIQDGFFELEDYWMNFNDCAYGI